MEISVYKLGQEPAESCPAPHKTTRTVAKLVLLADLAEKIGQNAIRLLTDRSWQEVKSLARRAISRQRIERTPDLPYYAYPANPICQEPAFQRAMTYPVLIARDQRSPWANWATFLQNA